MSNESKKDFILRDEQMVAEMFPDKEIEGEIMLSIHPNQYNEAIYNADDDTLTQVNDVEKTNNHNYEKSYKIHTNDRGW